MKPDQKINYNRWREKLIAIQWKYNPEHDIDTGEGAPPVTANEMTLTMVVKELLEEVEYLRKQVDAQFELFVGQNESIVKLIEEVHLKERKE